MNLEIAPCETQSSADEEIRAALRHLNNAWVKSESKLQKARVNDAYEALRKSLIDK